MQSTITSVGSQSNTFFSQSATFDHTLNELSRNPTKDGLIMPIVTPLIKLNKSEFAVLKTIKFYTGKTLGLCNLKFETWKAELELRDAKGLCYRQLKRVLKKLRDSGYIESQRINGDRTKRYTHIITTTGKLAYLQLSIKAKDKVKKCPLEKDKNVPSNDQKCPLENEKMSPRDIYTPNCIKPYLALRESLHCDASVSGQKEDVKVNYDLLSKLKSAGLYHGEALKVTRNRSEGFILNAIKRSKSSSTPLKLLRYLLKAVEDATNNGSQPTGSTYRLKLIEIDQQTGLVKNRLIDEANGEISKNAFLQMIEQHAQRKNQELQKQCA